eukprot:4622136-Amphidinium_carterae.1
MDGSGMLQMQASSDSAATSCHTRFATARTSPLERSNQSFSVGSTSLAPMEQVAPRPHSVGDKCASWPKPVALQAGVGGGRL